MANLDNDAIAELLKELAVGEEAEAKAAAVKLAEEDARKEKKVSVKVFSTYGAAGGVGEGGVTEIGEVITVKERALPKKIAPLGGLGGVADPWSSTTKEALPKLAGSPLPSPAEETFLEKFEIPYPRNIVNITCTPPHSGIVPMKRWGHATAAVGTSIFIFGGMRSSKEGSEASNDLHEFNLETKAWDPCFIAKGDPPPPRYGAAMTHIADSLILYGGCADGTLRSDVHEYNTDTQEWYPLAPDPEKKHPERAESSIVVHHKKVVIFGGRCPLPEGKKRKMGYSSELWTFDTKNKKWKHIKEASGPTKRAGHAACKIGNSMFIHGGCNTDTVFDDLWKYDFETSNWAEIAKAGIPRHGHYLSFLNYGTPQRPVPLLFVYGGTKDVPHVLQWTTLHLPQWYTIHVTGALSQAGVSQTGGGCMRNGALHLFGGSLAPTSEPTNQVLSMLVMSDIIAERTPLSTVMQRLLRRTQQRPAEYGADMQILVNGRTRYAHKALLIERASEVYSIITPCRTGASPKGMEEYILDSNKRRKGIPCIPDADALYSLLNFAYSGRLSDYDNLELYSAMAVEIKYPQLADFVNSIQAVRDLRRVGGSSPSKGPMSARVMHAEEVSNGKLAADLKRMRHNPAACDVTVGSSVGGSRFMMAHSVVLSMGSAVLRRAVNEGRGGGKLLIEVEEKIRKVTVVDVPTFGVEVTLAWLYGEEVQVGLDNAAGVMETANILNLPHLRTLCEKEIWSQMAGQTPDELCSLIATASRYHATQLYDKALATLSSCTEDHLVSLPSFNSLETPLQKEILKTIHDSSMRVSLKPQTQQHPGAYKPRIDSVLSQAATMK